MIWSIIKYQMDQFQVSSSNSSGYLMDIPVDSVLPGKYAFSTQTIFTITFIFTSISSLDLSSLNISHMANMMFLLAEEEERLQNSTR